MTLEQRVAALEARIGAADPNNADPVVTRMSKVQVAMDSVVNWKDKFALWFKETGLFDLIVQDVLSRVPKPSVVDLPAPSSTELIDGLLWHRSTNGIGIAFESDTNGMNGQRPPGTKYRQVFCVALSDDGGGGIHQNLIYPEDGGRAYIPDPTRFGVSYRLDRQGMMSLNIHRAGEQFAPGKFAVTAVHKGQLAVVIPEESGSVTLRLPQGGDLLVEKGNGNADRENGHKATISRQPVVLGDDVGSPAIGGLPGGGGT
jgi:hypothetical protein